MASFIESIPSDLSRSIAICVASSSLIDLCNFKFTCKFLNELGEDKDIFRHVSMDTISFGPWTPTQRTALLIQRSCLENQNPQALFKLGMVEYFSRTHLNRGRQLLERAACLGHEEAAYALGIILVCGDDAESIQKGMEVLSSIEESMRRKHVEVSECRKKAKQALWRIQRTYLPQMHEPICTNPDCTNKNIIIPESQRWLLSDEIDYIFDCEACKWSNEVALFCDVTQCT